MGLSRTKISKTLDCLNILRCPEAHPPCPVPAQLQSHHCPFSVGFGPGTKLPKIPELNFSASGFTSPSSPHAASCPSAVGLWFSLLLSLRTL